MGKKLGRYAKCNFKAKKNLVICNLKMNRLVWPKYLVILCSHSVRRLIKFMKKSLIIYTLKFDGSKFLTRTFSYSVFDEYATSVRQRWPLDFTQNKVYSVF